MRFANIIDQGLFNYLYLDKVSERHNISFRESGIDTVVHFSYTNFTTPFPNVPVDTNSSQRAIIIHIYYQASDDFRKEILKVCPRITKNMTNYLDKKCKNIEYLEDEIKKTGN